MNQATVQSQTKTSPAEGETRVKEDGTVQVAVAGREPESKLWLTLEGPQMRTTPEEGTKTSN